MIRVIIATTVLVIGVFPAHGAGSIAGKINDLDTGKPVADVRVVLSPVVRDAQAVPPRRDGNSPLIETLSNKRGSYKFESVPAGDWHVCVRDDEVAALTDPLVTLTGKDREKHVDIRVSKGATIEGGVYSDIDFEKGVPGLVIDVVQSYEKCPRMFSTVTDSGGKYRIGGLPPGEYFIRLVPGQDWHKVSNTFVDDTALYNDQASIAGPDVSLKRVEFQVAPAYRVVGRVVDRDGKPVPGAGIGLSAELEYFSQATVSDANGQFMINGLDDATGNLMAVKDERFSRRTPYEAVESASGKTGTPCVLTVMKPSRIRGHVVDKKGNPYLKVNCHINIPAENAVTSKGLDLDANGAFDSGPLVSGEYGFDLYNWDNPENEDSVHLKVTVGDEECLDDCKLVFPYGSGDPKRALEEGKTISGCVTDEAGKPVAGVKVWCIKSLNQSISEATTGISGEYLLKTDIRETYEPLTLVFMCAGYCDGTVREVKLDSKDNNVSLKPAPVVKVRIVKYENGEPISCSTLKLKQEMIAGLLMTTETEQKLESENGEFTGQLSPGLWQLTADASGYLPETKSVTVKPDTGAPVEFQLSRRGNTIDGTVLNANGKPVEGADIWLRSAATDRNDLLPNGQGRIVTDNKGRFTIGEVHPGKVSIDVQHPLYSRLVQEMSVLEGVNKVELLLQKKGSLAGHITLGGKPLQGAIVQPYNGIGFHAPSNAEGRYRQGDLDVGPQSVGVEYGQSGTETRYLYKDVVIEPEGVTEVNFDFAPGTSGIEGRLTIDGTRPGMGWLFIRVYSENGQREDFYPRTDEEGLFHVAGLPPGKAKIRFGNKENRNTIEVDLPPNEILKKDLCVKREGVTISGKVASADPDRHSVMCLFGSYTLEDLAKEPVSPLDPRLIGGSRLDAEGNFSISGVQPGTVALLVRDVTKRGRKPVTDAEAVAGITTLEVGTEPIKDLTLEVSN